MTSLTWRGELAPGLTRDSHGKLSIAGCDVIDLVATYATPLMVLDCDLLASRTATLRTAAQEHGVRVSYSAKALFTPALARFFDERGLGIDLSSLGELAVAQRAAVAPDHLTLHGSGKGTAEMAAAIDGRVGRIVVDDLLELAMLHELAMHANTRVEILVRCAIREPANTHSAIATSGEDTKFGIAACERALAWGLLRDSAFLHFAGIHAHAGSQIYAIATFENVIDTLLDLLEETAAFGLIAEHAIAGGGFGVRMHPITDEDSLDLVTTVTTLAERFQAGCRERGLVTPHLGIEPGRSLIADAGTTLYRVQAVKHQERHRFVIIDGGLSDNPRPALYDAYHHVVCASARHGEMLPAIVCGRSCENDEFARVDLPSDLLPGDILAVCTTGAYTYSMASNYNRFGRPAIIAIDAGQSRLITRRETVEDMLRLDC